MKFMLRISLKGCHCEQWPEHRSGGMHGRRRAYQARFSARGGSFRLLAHALPARTNETRREAGLRHAPAKLRGIESRSFTMHPLHFIARLLAPLKRAFAAPSPMSLASLDARTLRDIGLYRCEIGSVEHELRGRCKASRRHVALVR
jgi:hypothetical protein